MKNKVIVINGPTAVGKSAVIRLLLEKDRKLLSSITYTTRPKRAKMPEDKILHHISESEFEQMIRDNELLEWAEFSGNLYGSGKIENLRLLKKSPLIFNIEYKGLVQLKKSFPTLISIFIMPESKEQLIERLKRRKISSSLMKKRIKEIDLALTHSKDYDYQVINREGLIEHTVKDILAIIKPYCAT